MRSRLQKNPEYWVWAAMLQRCRNPRCRIYPLYGGRGITVCERWTDVRNFMADMGPRPEGGTLDRIDNDGNYEPGNCRWATPAIQSANTRRAKFLTLNGETRQLHEWAAHLGLTAGALCTRIKRWGVEKALSTPVYDYMRRY